MRKQLRSIIVLLLILMTTLMVFSGCNQESKRKYPNGDITFLIPSGAGGGNDASVRALIQGMKNGLGVNIIPENKPASNGTVAAMEIVNGKPDGQKLYFNSQTLILMPHAGMKDINLDKFQPVAQVLEDTAAVMVRADSPYKTLDEFVKAAGSSKLKVGHNGVGGIWHLSAVLFSKEIGADFQYIAYTSGGNQMLTALVAGEVDFCVIGPPESKPLVDAGKIRALVVLNDEKHPVIPNTPTSKEAGLKLTFPVWRGIFTTKGADESVLETLNKTIKSTVESEDFKAFARNSGFPIKYRNYKEFTEFIVSERTKYDKLMNEIKK